MTDRRAQLLADEDAAWIEFHDLIDRVRLDLLDDPTLPEGWTVNDLAFHVGAWLADAGDELERIAAGTFVRNDETSDRQNEEWLELSRTLDAETCRAQLESGRIQMLRCFTELPELTPDAIEWFEESGALHYRAHLQDLRAWLDEHGL
ncbi:MAG: maleylpyruvate isomerase N-terminal domain-containing protein [Actinomycetota bacterium]